MRIKRSIVVMVMGLLCASCSSLKTGLYFRDIESGVAMESAAEAKPITLKPDDKISVLISTKDQLLDERFNIMASMRNISGSVSASTMPYSSYRVDAEGYIEMPELGRISVKGMTRDQVVEVVRTRLIEEGFVSDPVVLVDFVNLGVTVLGEVNKPGRYDIDRDHINIVEAIGMAGDMTIYGVRDNVKVVRVVDGEPQVYMVDLSDAQRLYSSPAFYVEQNDVIYVEPNNKRLRESTVNGNNLFSLSFWVSMSSFFITVALLFL